MDSITLKGYRCFRAEQTARLAPLTLLVGENSTGKTSFLAALRALWDAAFLDIAPDFREPPYDLGSFEDVAYSSGVRGRKAADSFSIGFDRNPAHPGDAAISFRATFKERDGFPFPVKRSFAGNGARIEIDAGEDEISFSVQQKKWKRNFHFSGYARAASDRLFPLKWALSPFERDFAADSSEFVSYPSDDDMSKGHDLVFSHRTAWERYSSEIGLRPFAAAPMQARPQRTYDPVRPQQDAEGEYIFSYLANKYRQAPDEWHALKASLEKFGRSSGLFDEIAIKSFGKTEGAPFQVHVRKFGKRAKGRGRNLIDVGYGVSQALPMLTELLRPDAPGIFLLQQPEVHLHPSAQAALGSLFCSVAAPWPQSAPGQLLAPGRQLIVETHSDSIIDRVRMDARDKTTRLRPEDVSILYFERDEFDVNIHSIRIDNMGNVLDAPLGYRQFFTDELMRSIGVV